MIFDHTQKRESLLLYAYEEEDDEEKSPSTINEGRMTSPL